MTEIRYVVLSDVHFGAQNSMLTSVVEKPGSPAATGRFEVAPDVPSPLLVAAMDGLRTLVAGQSQPPTLILAGDVLDLALSSDAVASTAFGCFVDLAFGGSTPLFGPSVYYLPGNHDHHLWEGAREAQYIKYLQDLAPGEPLEDPWHVTSLSADLQRPAGNDFLTALVKRRHGCRGVDIHHAYPNLALTDPSGRRCRIISHGHLTEPIYTLMSSLRDVLFPEQADRSPSIAQIESENFAWIDFFWSTLGRSGEVGTDVGLVYADLSSAADLDELAGNLAKSLVSRNHGPHWLRPLESALTVGITRREVRHLARSERGTPGLTLSAKSESGLRSYLEGPVLRQITEELGSVSDDVAFIFGHTHKPFVEQRQLTGYPQPVCIYNTGGWVVDTSAPALTQGAVAVLLDEELNVASLQFYRQNSAGGTDPVQVLALAEPGVNPLHDKLAAEVDPSAEPWRTVSDAAAQLIAQRYRLQATITAAKA